VRPPRRIHAAGLQRSLPEDALLLDYFCHENALGALSLTREALLGHPALLAVSRLESLTQAVLFSLRGAAFAPAGQRAADPALEAQLAELAALVLWPALDGRSPRSLAIAPAGPLARVPWAALPLPDGRALCECAEVVVVPGLRLGLSWRSARAPSGAPLVVAADAGELAAVEPETAALLAAYPRATVLAGAEATADRFLALAPEAAWIHFAGHGGWRAGAPHESGLRLHDRWLLAGELADLSLAANWVTLSACHTARALVRPGAEWFGLSRSFLQSGARAVVAAQWDVEDGPTATLMADLYPRLAGGAPLARALAAAQSAQRQRGSNPLDWAGFVAFGGPGLLSGGGTGRGGRARGRSGLNVRNTHETRHVPSAARGRIPSRFAPFGAASTRARQVQSPASGGSRP